MTGGLHITRLRVEQLRRFRQPMELRGFEPGLNIVAAPNEAGKSTLVRAIRAAFFERHRSTAVDDLRPWGEGAGAAPQVEIDFDFGGQSHRLAKSFLGKKRCTLQIGTRSLDGTDAEDHLAQLFGFAFAAKGLSKAEHWGIPGLLWVEQGTGQDLNVSHARDHLHDALQGQAGAAAGALAATGGDELLDQLRAQRGELLTATGKPRAAYAEAAETIAAAQAELEAMDTQIATYRQQVDQLAAVRQQQGADEAARPWDRLRLELAAAQQQQEALGSSQGLLAADEATVQQLETIRGGLYSQLDALAQHHTQADARAQSLAEDAARLEIADAAMAAARQQAEAARARSQQAQAAVRAARQAAQRGTLVQQLRQAEADVARSTAQWQRAEAAQAEVLALRQSTAASRSVGKAEIRSLVALDRAARDAAVRHHAVATRLRFSLPDGQVLELQTQGQRQRLQATGELLVDAPATLQLPGGGELVITPGGDDLAELARRHADADEDLRAALQALGVADLVEAQTLLAAAAERQEAMRLAEQALAIVAPDGPEPLRQQRQLADDRVGQLQDQLARLPAEGGNALPLDDAERDQEAAATAERSTGDALALAQRQQATAQSLRDTAHREHEAARALLADPSRQQRQQQAQAQLLATGAERDALLSRIGLTRAQLQQGRPEFVAQDIERLQRSIAQITTAHQQRREQILLLENTLQQAGVQGLEEQRGAKAGQLAQAERRHVELQRRANALDLLCRMLDDRRQATLARLQAPLQDRLQHYLPLLLPGATVQIDAGLAPGTLTRLQAGGAMEAGQVQDLSFGAREQIGLISRFAYADLLQRAGRPTLVILDDALVHSDAARLSQMKRVLFDAASRHQVLLFTCHPEDWRDMGVAVRALA